MIERYGETLFVGNNDEQDRLALLQQIYDPLTTTTLAGILTSLPAATRALEIGTGGGSIARWLTSAVGAGGIVVATDVDPGVVERLTADHIDARLHDVTVDEFPEASFDLIHARLVLSHLPDRIAVLKKLRRWLCPGGSVVIESFGWYPVDSSPNPDYATVMHAWEACVREIIGTDSRWTRLHPEPLIAAGFVDVHASTTLQHINGGTSLAAFWAGTVAMSHQRLVEGHFADDDELAVFAALLRDPDFWDLAPAFVAMTGRRPS
jgi:SAM-dependent methyltransferase